MIVNIESTGEIERVGDRAVTVELNIDEYILAISTGLNRAEANEDSTPRNKSAIRSHCEGAVGDMMACKYLGVNFDNTVTDVYDGDVDLVLGGDLMDVLIDVKVSTHEDPRLLVKKRLVEEGEAEIYIHARIDEGEVIPRRGQMIGYKSSEWLENNITPEPGPRDFINYKLGWEATNPIEELEDRLGKDEQIVREPISEVVELTDVLTWEAGQYE